MKPLWRGGVILHGPMLCCLTLRPFLMAGPGVVQGGFLSYSGSRCFDSRLASWVSPNSPAHGFGCTHLVAQVVPTWLRPRGALRRQKNGPPFGQAWGRHLSLGCQSCSSARSKYGSMLATQRLAWMSCPLAYTSFFGKT